MYFLFTSIIISLQHLHFWTLSFDSFLCSLSVNLSVIFFAEKRVHGFGFPWFSDLSELRFVMTLAAAAVTSVVSDSVRPHRRQATRLHRPWDSPGKNTGVGCHFLLQSMKMKSESEVTQSCPSLHDPMDYSLPGFSIHGIFQARVLEWGATAFSSGRGLNSPKFSFPS